MPVHECKVTLPKAETQECKCKNVRVVILQMHEWAKYVGHEQTNKLLARRKAGEIFEIILREYCGACADCVAYHDWLQQFASEPIDVDKTAIE
jgi:hypothetical protein